MLAGCGNDDRDIIVKGDIAARVDKHMTDAEGKGFSGAVLIAKDGKVILARGYGFADKARNLRWTPDTVFDICDLTKLFTAAAALKLEMMDKLSLNDTILKYFERIPILKANIRISQMLTHTTGFPRSIGEANDPITRDEYIRLALGTRIPFKPGDYFRYSNVGYALAGIIIEYVSGGSYEAFLQERLFKPAGMLNTGYLLPEWNRDLIAHGYLRQGEDGGTPLDQTWAEDGPYWHLRASGGMLSSVRDLYRWHLALKGTEILSEEAKEQYFTPRVSMGPRTSAQYGYGWVITTTPRNTTLYSHEGTNGVFSADFRWFAEEDVIIIMAGNATDYPVADYNRQVADLVFGDISLLELEAADILRKAKLLETPVARQALELLKTTAEGNEEGYKGYIESRFAPSFREKLPLAEHIRLLRQMHSELGAAVLEGAEKTGPFACDLTVMSPQTKKKFLIKMTVESKLPNGITGIGIRPVE